MKKINNNDVELIMLDKHNMKPLIDYINELQCYKERIEKAIEYIERQPRRELSVDCYFKFKDLVEFDELLNILKGEE